MGKVVKSDFFKSGANENETSVNKAVSAAKPVSSKNAPAKPSTDNKTEKLVQKPVEKPAAKQSEKTGSKPAVKPVAKKRVSPMRINKKVMDALKQTAAVLTSCGRKKAAREIDNIYLRGTRNLFTVAVVGEFSRGKSTFLNGMIGKDILPVGDLPTTAMLTHIRYNTKDTMVHIDLAGNMISVPPAQDSWDGLVADNFGRCDPEGAVHIGLKNQWLGENNIELMDTPGAGDLEDKRAQSIGEALLGSDGAVITISAASPLSLTEKTFIEERLLSRKTPFLMLVITKLDTISKKERASVVEYIINKLRSWKMDIPVFIPAQVEIENDLFKDITGYDKVKAQILKWINDPHRVKLTEAWISAQAVSVLERELEAMRNQKELMDIDDEKKRAELIAARKQSLQKAEEIWDNLCNEMQNRSSACFTKVIEKVNESTKSIIERLQYEVSHSNTPEKWWKEDYPYRLKIELTNMSVAATNVMSRTVTDDTRWLNAAFEQNFKSRLAANPQDITADKLHERGGVDAGSVKLSDIDKQRKGVKIGSSVLTIVGASATVALKMSSLVWTMGVGTCISLLSDAIFKKELEDQRDKLKKKIAEDVPKVIGESVMKTKSKVEYIYDDILSTANEKKKEWIDAQTSAIEKCTEAPVSADKEKIAKQIETIDALLKKLTK